MSPPLLFLLRKATAQEEQGTSPVVVLALVTGRDHGGTDASICAGAIAIPANNNNASLNKAGEASQGREDERRLTAATTVTRQRKKGAGCPREAILPRTLLTRPYSGGVDTDCPAAPCPPWQLRYCDAI